MMIVQILAFEIIFRLHTIHECIFISIGEYIQNCVIQTNVAFPLYLT